MSRLNAIEITTGYPNKTIIENLSVAIPEGKITSLIGPNGSGKSTLLKSFTRILPVKNGKILVNDRELTTYHSKELARKLALLAQTSEYPLGMTVEEVVSYGRYPYQKLFSGMDDQDLQAIEWALTATNLIALKDRDIASLSGGQAQRVWIAMALAQEADILILDEPTTFLDPAHQLEILDLLTEINRMKKTTILMSIHDINHASRFSDYLVAMKEGRLVVDGTPEEVITKEWMREIFEIDAQIVQLPETNKPVFLTYDLIKKQEEK
ncbi:MULTISPECIES: ABC transporter ATP-binding protein [unclassified Enterococcus]|uniref:ABC transporter ATP-binding protein n=1 Tax=unclassified Enterococcus TaxID=2608891 RepID=UPI001A934D5C|nr:MULTISPECIES: ABC transporter ATP-binding protein [unclassified Enterococcus]MBO0461302.1 ABC transporter ATP-binding protein [Enterococcus sp. DIV1298c]MBO1301234.1 ABC transporter ATP-binding protein [Enterococcus sp. DIV1271a]